MIDVLFCITLKMRIRSLEVFKDTHKNFRRV